jgi:hypothetical protein
MGPRADVSIVIFSAHAQRSSRREQPKKKKKKNIKMGMCMSTLCCPVCFFGASVCGVAPMTTCCSRSGLMFLEKKRTLVASVVLLLIGASTSNASV